MLASPCVNICRLNAERRFCVGCHRTTEEIAAWPYMTDAQKIAVLEVLAKRAGVLSRLDQPGGKIS